MSFLVARGATTAWILPPKKLLPGGRRRSRHILRFWARTHEVATYPSKERRRYASSMCCASLTMHTRIAGVWCFCLHLHSRPCSNSPSLCMARVADCAKRIILSGMIVSDRERRSPSRLRPRQISQIRAKPERSVTNPYHEALFTLRQFFS